MSCDHFDEFKEVIGLENYEIIQSTIIFPNKSIESNAHEVYVSCFGCGKYNGDCRLMACLHCVYFGCHNDHMLNHYTTKQHFIGVEISNGHIYCYVCRDVVFDSEAEEIMSKCQNESSEPTYSPWKPTPFECKLLQEHPRRVKLDPNSSLGMRGMMNLGNTCFMSVIFQALLHTPLLRDYFFSDKHVCYVKVPEKCFFCYISKIFQRYYSNDDPSTLSLHDVFCIVWKLDPNLVSTKEQKDAHEFFLSTRNLLHQFSTPPNTNQIPCDCIVDSIFYGTLQSDLVCSACCKVSTTMDPFWEISLDIPEPPNAATLFDCLQHFTRPEMLDAEECSNCNSKQVRTKQFTFKLLPLILVIHLKRFDQQLLKGDILIHKKKSLYVSYPVDLDLSPFLSARRNKISAESSNNEDVSVKLDSSYSLYAVIVHSGTLHGGHYLSYIRMSADKWFMCSDMNVEPATVETVLDSEAYLLFYHKTTIPYE